MIPVRSEGEGVSGQMEDVSGEMYVLSYSQTATGARLTVAARTRGEFVPPGIEPGQDRPMPTSRCTSSPPQTTRGPATRWASLAEASAVPAN